MYLDTGILVKLLTPEPETAYFEQQLRGHPLVTSELSVVEVKSALFAKERAGSIDAVRRMKAEAKFSEMIESEIVTLLNLNNRVLRKATQTIQACHPKVPLRALDALHVATCDLAQEFPLCTTDARMHAAAQAMRLPVFPEQLPVKTQI
ncbi:MAG TPA: type II toxin-antitoxin system VapC family toxin [Candidatus Paceibacterota bacterium]|nr:type II toxin-antitoxin system VapC family toxin [Candidatus Paceibacterota bacterium]